MISVLIMDDKQDKIKMIVEVLIKKCLLSEECIDKAESLNEGRALLAKKQYDLLLLDLLMPVNKDEDIRADESANFINELSIFKRFKKPLQIIGLSEHYDQIEAHIDDYNTKLWKLIPFERKSVDWERLLQNAVQAIDDMKNAMIASVCNVNKYDVGIICALQKEFDEMKSASKLEWIKFSVENYPCDFYRTEMRTSLGYQLKIVGCCCNIPGMQSASIVSTLMISLFGIRSLFMTGFCAGFKSDNVNYGDIFIAQSEMDYGSKKIIEKDGVKQELPEPRAIECDYQIISKLNTYISEVSPENSLLNQLKKQHFEINTTPNIFIAPGACGSYVVSDESFMKELQNKNNRKFKGLEMEGYGLYLSGHILKCPCLLIKGIADMGDSGKGDKYHSMCSYASAYFLFEFLKYSY